MHLTIHGEEKNQNFGFGTNKQTCTHTHTKEEIEQMDEECAQHQRKHHC